MTVRFEPVLSCGTCDGRGFLIGDRGLSSPCWCVQRPLEVS